MTDTIIPYLPDHLTVVPPGPRSSDDPERDERRAAYLAWRDAVYSCRVERQDEVRVQPARVPLELHYCAQNFAYFLAMYGTIFEPRDDRTHLGGGDLPFIPFAKQVELADFLINTLAQRGSGADAVVSKPRDVGASWIVCAIALWGWLFKHPWDALLLSRKEDLVDSKNQASLFAKIDRLFWNLPPWMRPEGFDPDRHRQKLFLLNPDNLNELSGESTTAKSGRGSRTTWAAFDEAAFIPELFNTWNGISSTTSHRWAISTESLDDGPDFYNLRTGTDMEHRPALFEIDWWDNPLNDDAYFADMKQRMASRPADFAREILRNPHMTSSLVYGQFHDPKYAPDPNRNAVLPMAATYITIDPGKLDETAIVVIQEDPVTLEHTILDSYQNKGKDADFYGTLLAGTPDEDKFPDYYGEREHDFMALLRAIPAPTYCGDVYGDTSNGATLDTFYSVLGRYDNPQGERIQVNRDRLGNKDRGMYRKQRSTFKGRQQCVHELSQGLRFSGRPGAVFAHRCVTNHRFKPQDRPMMSEPNAPIHDWTCLHGDTRIRTLNGWIPIKALVGLDDVYLWSYSDVHRRLVPSKAERIWRSGENVPLLAVRLDNDRVIRCTPEHRFMRRDGTWVEAQHLAPGDALMPFYESNNRQYTRVTLNDGSKADEHVYVYTWFNGMPPTGSHIHHKDGDRTHNDPENLEAISIAEHCKITLAPTYVDPTHYQRIVEHNEARRVIKTCLVCRTEFAASYKQLYCSTQCQRRALSNHKALNRSETWEHKPCVVCGTSFAGAPRRKTCGPICSKQHARNLQDEYQKQRIRHRGALPIDLPNHVVLSVTPCEAADVYDISVPEYHNFVAEGVIVHNSHVMQAIEFWAVYKKTRADLLGTPGHPKPLTQSPTSLARLITPRATKQRATLSAGRR